MPEVVYEKRLKFIHFNTPWGQNHFLQEAHQVCKAQLESPFFPKNLYYLVDLLFLQDSRNFKGHSTSKFTAIHFLMQVPRQSQKNLTQDVLEGAAQVNVKIKALGRSSDFKEFHFSMFITDNCFIVKIFCRCYQIACLGLTLCLQKRFRHPYQSKQDFPQRLHPHFG